MKHLNRVGIFAVIAAASLVTVAFGQTYAIEGAFVNHLQAGMNEQDVFVADGDAVYRVPLGAEPSDEPLFASAVAVEHNPGDMDDLGPFAKGAALGFTQAEWLAGTGMLHASCESGVGSVAGRFEDLVPHGTYTLWLAYIVTPVTVPFRDVVVPVGATNGSQNVFVADELGHARFSVPLEQCLSFSIPQLATAIALAYHSDGLSHGIDPGDFGLNSHVQLISFMPPAE